MSKKASTASLTKYGASLISITQLIVHHEKLESWSLYQLPQSAKIHITTKLYTDMLRENCKVHQELI